MSTYFPKEGEIARKWYVVDATGRRSAGWPRKSRAFSWAKRTRKYTPFIDTGDHVIVINAEKIKTTGMKAEQKAYHHYTGYPGGIAHRRIPQAHGAQAGADD